MRLFSKRQSEQPDERPVRFQRAFRRCSYCRVSGIPLAYCDNGHDYCRPCFFRASDMLRLRSIGRRMDDLDPFTGATVTQLLRGT